MMKKIIVVHPRRAPPVFVCRKCLKRSDDAKGITRALKSELKRSVGDREKPARVIKTSCFGICPKRSVVMTGSAAAGHGDYVLISSGTEVSTAIERLRGDTAQR
jgi:predicted metal-binding protein